MPNVTCSLLQVWFMDSVQKVLEDLDPELPYFITDVSCLLPAAPLSSLHPHTACQCCEALCSQPSLACCCMLLPVAMPCSVQRPVP